MFTGGIDWSKALYTNRKGRRKQSKGKHYSGTIHKLNELDRQDKKAKRKAINKSKRRNR